MPDITSTRLFRETAGLALKLEPKAINVVSEAPAPTEAKLHGHY